MNYHIYILRLTDNKLYIGHTNNKARRVEDHGNSLGAKFVKDHGGEFKLVYSEEFSTRSEAMQREKQLKGWSRAKKEALIKGDIDRLKKLSSAN